VLQKDIDDSNFDFDTRISTREFRHENFDARISTHANFDTREFRHTRYAFRDAPCSPADLRRSGKSPQLTAQAPGDINPPGRNTPALRPPDCSRDPPRALQPITAGLARVARQIAPDFPGVARPETRTRDPTSAHRDKDTSRHARGTLAPHAHLPTRPASRTRMVAKRAAARADRLTCSATERNPRKTTAFLDGQPWHVRLVIAATPSCHAGTLHARAICLHVREIIRLHLDTSQSRTLSAEMQRPGVSKSMHADELNCTIAHRRDEICSTKGPYLITQGN